jgi:hypothetical protein
MDTSGAGEVAQLLGVPLSRVLRWCRAGRVAASKDDHGRWVLSRVVIDDLIRTHGSTPAPHPEGRSRNELLVLAALVRAPRGLPSARAVAVVTGTAPTTASATLASLSREGLAQQREEHRIVRGRSRRMTLWYANLDAPTVQSMLPYLHRVALPDPPASSAGNRLPDHLWHLFWNADPTQVDPQRDATVIAHRAMTTADPEAIAWAVGRLPAAAFQEALGHRGTPPEAVAWLRACVAQEVRRAAA